MVCVVVNRHKEEFDVYIGRGTKWGNPYENEPRLIAIHKFEKLFTDKIRNGIITKSDLLELKDKRLGCSCKPLPCHGDIIAYAVNKITGYDVTITTQTLDGLGI